MKVYVQWTKQAATDWSPLDVRGNVWRHLPRKPLPRGGELLDDSEGWVHALNCQGITFEGFDHYAVEPIPGNGVRITVWQDDPDDFPDGTKFAQVWELLPPAPDQRLGGRMNTRQKLTVYADDPSRFSQSDIMAEPCKPWSEFVSPPAAVIHHGIWASDPGNAEHIGLRSTHGWREWADG